MAKTHINLRLSELIINELNLRAHKPQQPIERDLERYYALLEDARRELKAKLTEAELNLVADALSGTLFSEPFSIKALPMEISDAIKYDGLDKKWEVSAPDLQEKLNSLTTTCLYALVDLVERFWRSDRNDISPSNHL